VELRYLGFDQNQNIRTYRFDRVVVGGPAARFLVTADMALFLKHHVGIQEGPSLCARKLTSDPECTAGIAHELTNDDLLAYALARSEAEAHRAAARKSVPNRRHRREPEIHTV
jgi:hypothetical protein